MKVYLAHNYSASKELIPIAEAMKTFGLEVTSRWIWLAQNEPAERTPEFLRSSAQIDLVDLLSAEIVVFFAKQHGWTPGKGKYIELGVALSTGKIVVVVAENQTIAAQECVFLALPQLIFVKDETEAINFVKEIQEKFGGQNQG